MANEEHVAILKQGVAEWNAWREANPDTRPDLRGAELPGAYLFGRDPSGAGVAGMNLSGANLGGANLREATLFRANLTRAHLSGANLTHANLTRADVTGAYLQATHLTDADLSNATLVGAHLVDTIFGGARLDDADMTKAELFDTSFARVDLRGVKGLEQVVHLGPSTVGIDTLYLSEGDIPDVFLRGCGVPEEMIDFAHALSGAVKTYSCFISYAVKDEVFARRLYADLQAAGVRCWLAQEDLKPGDRTWNVIEGQIRIKNKLLLILSAASIESEAVQREVELGLAQEEKTGRQILFPLYIDDVALKSRKRWIVKLRDERNLGKFTGWEEPVIYAARLDEVIGWLKPAAVSAPPG